MMWNSSNFAVRYGLLCTTAVSLLAIPVLLQSGRSPALAAPAVTDSICYMETNGGSNLDLSRLCGGDTTTSDQPIQDGVVVTEVSQSGMLFTGKVMNYTSHPVAAVVIHYTVDSPDASAEDLSSTFVDQGLLNPQEEGTFQGELTRSGSIKVLSVDWAPSN